MTVSRRAFGISMPITLRPGTVATRTEVTLMLRAISSASEITRAARDRAPWDAALPAHIVASGHHWPLWFSAGMLANAVAQTLLLLFLSDPARAESR